MKRIMLLLPLTLYGDSLDFMDQSRPIVDVIPPLTQEYVPPFKEPKTFYITYHKTNTQNSTPDKILVKQHPIAITLANEIPLDATATIFIENSPDARAVEIPLPAGSTKTVRIPCSYWLIKPDASVPHDKPRLHKECSARVIVHIPSHGSYATLIDPNHPHLKLIRTSSGLIELITD